MIASVKIEGMRGVRSGILQNLSALTVLVGPNGAGKSTVLDALLVGTSPRPAEAIGRAIRRRWEQTPVGEWFFYRRTGKAQVEVGTAGTGTKRFTELEWHDESFARSLRGMQELMRRDEFSNNVVGAVTGVVRIGEDRASVCKPQVLLSAQNEYQAREEFQNERAKLVQASQTRLIDMRGVEFGARQMPEVLTDAVAEGRADAAIELLKVVVPGLKDVRILMEGPMPVVHLVNGSGSVPLGMAGDGIRGLARLAFEFAARKDGLLLVEEPEVHQHPRSLAQTATATAEVVKRGLQVVMATHSLDLIDLLVTHCATLGLLDRLSVCQLRLEEGALGCTRYSGEDVKLARGDMELELR